MGPMKSSMYSHPAGPCNHCGVETTPCWRKGPPEKPHLCNACGSRWLAKHDLKGYHPGKRTPCRPEFTRDFYSKAGSQQSYSDSGSGFGKVPTKKRKVRSYDGSESVRTSAFRPWIVQKADASTQTDGPDMVPVVIMRPSFPPFAGYGLERVPSGMSMAPSIVECLSRTTSFNKEGPCTPYTAAAAPAPFDRVVPGSLAECNALSACNNPRPSLFKTKDKLSNSCPSESCPTTIYVDSR